MHITEVRISLRDDVKLKAFASITLDDCFVIRGLKIIKGQTGTLAIIVEQFGLAMMPRC